MEAGGHGGGGVGVYEEDADGGHCCGLGGGFLGLSSVLVDDCQVVWLALEMVRFQLFCFVQRS